ncbi:hypothetical protein [Actinomadura roseirufa]|uniref:hypothetical protein n=1 Tax=Actinomadura roseirufa TaxID=2094049 RepID=UPI001040F765|nr:hypothetical protein [Actinomadura roseirufa]
MTDKTRAELAQSLQKRIDWLLDPQSAAQRNDADVMRAVLHVYAGLARWGAADVTTGQALREQMRGAAIGEFLRGDRAQAVLSAYAGEGENYAQRGRLDGYLNACQHRTAIQALQDDFAAVLAISAPLALESVGDFDDLLCEVADDATPVHRGQIPSWAPSTHWWWWKPDNITVSMREYRARLYVGELEEYEGSQPGSADWLRCEDNKCWCFTAPP